MMTDTAIRKLLLTASAASRAEGTSVSFVNELERAAEALQARAALNELPGFHVKDEREAFEAWFKREYTEDINDPKSRPLYNEMVAARKAWQARAALQSHSAPQDKAATSDAFSLPSKCREFIDTATVPAYPAGAGLANEIDALLSRHGAQLAATLTADQILSLERRCEMTNDEAIRFARSVASALMHQPAASVEPNPRDWKAINAAIDEYADGYELRGEPGDHTPTEFERFLIVDAINGLLAEPEFMSLIAAQAQPVFDILAHLQRQREWSERTFGPGLRTAGVCDHIRKELREIEADPTDLREWIDVVILALDGAWRTGATPQQIIDAIVSKQTKNEGRAWPDWRTADPNKAIEHDRSGEATQAASKPAQEEREAFESWARKDSSGVSLETNAEGAYRDMCAALLWHAWQACAAMLADREGHEQWQPIETAPWGRKLLVGSEHLGRASKLRPFD